MCPYIDQKYDFRTLSLYVLELVVLILNKIHEVGYFDMLWQKYLTLQSQVLQLYAAIFEL